MICGFDSGADMVDYLREEEKYEMLNVLKLLVRSETTGSSCPRICLIGK